MSVYIRDNRVIVPALRDGAPTTGAITDMEITGAGVKFTDVIDVGTFTEILGFCNVTEFTSGTIDVVYQVSPDGKTFLNVGDAFAQITGAGIIIKKVTTNFGKYMRLKLTMSDPVDMVLSIYLACKS
jgi:hypothetical protein